MKIENRYNILEKIGSGGFSKVFSGKDSITGNDIAIKVDSSNIRSGKRKRELVIYEADVLSWIHRNGVIRGIPKLHWSGYIQSKNNNKSPAIIIDKLGDDLERVLQHRTLSIIETSHLGLGLLNILQNIHNRGILHRDLKPANIMLGHSDADIYIADFGLAKKYLDKTGSHIPYCDNKTGITGTIRYCSTYSHYGIESSRRDDMQSFLFILVYMLKGKLPWQSEKNKKKNVAKVKNQNFFEDTLCKDCPRQIQMIAKHISQLEFDEKPNYGLIKRLLTELIT